MADVFLEAFGQLANKKQEEDWLYPAFNNRAEMMRWTHTQSPSPPYAWLWHMYDAELTAGQGTPRLGWVYVGMYYGQIVVPDNLPTLVPTETTTRVDPNAGFPIPPGAETIPLTETSKIVFLSAGEYQHRHPVSPAEALPALGQCFEDALHRCVEFTWTCLQVSITGVESDIPPLPRIRGIKWFEMAPAASETQAHIAFDHMFLGGCNVATLVNRLHREYTFPFVFGPVVTVPEPHRIVVPATWHGPCHKPASLGLEVTLPEWTMTAAASALALVFNTVHKLRPNIRDCVLRVTRLR